LFAGWGYFFAHGLLTVYKWAKNDKLFKMIGSVLSGDSLPKDKIDGDFGIIPSSIL
jgi:hypothetical protein